MKVRRRLSIFDFSLEVRCWKVTKRDVIEWWYDNAFPQPLLYDSLFKEKFPNYSVVLSAIARGEFEYYGKKVKLIE